jgi:hypothetical protein
VREILAREKVFFGGLASLAGALPGGGMESILPFAFGLGGSSGRGARIRVLLLALGKSITGGGVLCQKGGRTYGDARGFLVLLLSCRENGSPPKLLRMDVIIF